MIYKFKNWKKDQLFSRRLTIFFQFMINELDFQQFNWFLTYYYMIPKDFMSNSIQFIALYKSLIFERFHVEFSKNRKCPVIYVILALI